MALLHQSAFTFAVLRWAEITLLPAVSSHLFLISWQGSRKREIGLGELCSDVKRAAPLGSTQRDAGVAKVLSGHSGGAVRGSQQSCQLADAHRKPQMGVITVLKPQPFNSYLRDRAEGPRVPSETVVGDMRPSAEQYGVTPEAVLVSQQRFVSSQSCFLFCLHV